MTAMLLRILSKPVLSLNTKRCIFLATNQSLSKAGNLSPAIKNKLYLTTKITSSRLYSASISSHEFGEICEETLDSLADYFEELVESVPALKNGDITYSDGVITASLGNDLGTYVINRQTPNQQIWLSSPTSGPKRYDFVDNVWVYKHDNTTLHSLLDKELVELLNCPVDFAGRCVFGSGKN